MGHPQSIPGDKWGGVWHWYQRGFSGSYLRIEGFKGYQPSLQMFGFWFSEKCMVGVGFGIDSDFFCFLERVRWRRF